MLARVTVFISILCMSVPAMARSAPDFTSLIEKVAPAVVKVSVSHGESAIVQRVPAHHAESDAIGSGFLITGDGYILTSYHVVAKAIAIQVRLQDRRVYSAALIGFDTRSDLALIKIEATKLPYVSFANSEQAKVGEWVLAIGSPFELDFSVSAGIISAKGRSIPTRNGDGYVPFIQTDLAINPGHSGGPVFNRSGRVVGVNSQIYSPNGVSVGLSFAIPSSVAKNVVTQLKAKGRVDRGWLGLRVQSVDPRLARAFGLTRPIGSLIAEVASGSPAEAGGLRAGDIILSFDDVAILESNDLPHIVGETEPGNKIVVEVLRDKKKLKLPVVVSALNTDTQDASVPANPLALTGNIGAQLHALSRSEQALYGLEGGVHIGKVFARGMAAQAGLESGDIIIQFAAEAVLSVEQLHSAISLMPTSTAVPIRIIRDGRYLFLSLELVEASGG